MCDCGTKQNTLPASGGGSSPAGGAIAVCPSFNSSIALLDEIGLPLRSVLVTVSIGGAAPKSMTTDGEGRICFMDPPGTAIDVTLDDTHEASPGDSTATASGQHFGRLKPGP
jgi:hypothetical protein